MGFQIELKLKFSNQTSNRILLKSNLIRIFNYLPRIQVTSKFYHPKLGQNLSHTEKNILFEQGNKTFYLDYCLLLVNIRTLQLQGHLLCNRKTRVFLHVQSPTLSFCSIQPFLCEISVIYL